MVYKHLLLSYAIADRLSFTRTGEGRADRESQSTGQAGSHQAQRGDPDRENITLLQRRTWNALLYNAYSELETKEEHSIPVKKLARLVGYDSHDMGYLKEAALAMRRCIAQYNVLGKDGSSERWGQWRFLHRSIFKRAGSPMPIARSDAGVCIIRPCMPALISTCKSHSTVNTCWPCGNYAPIIWGRAATMGRAHVFRLPNTGS